MPYLSDATVVDEILSAVRVQFRPDGKLANLSMPTARDYRDLEKALGRSIPEDLRALAQKRALDLVVKWRHSFLGRRQDEKVPNQVKLAEIIPADTAVDRLATDNVLMLCERHQLEFSNKGNPGLVAMRARNALRNAIKKGLAVGGL